MPELPGLTGEFPRVMRKRPSGCWWASSWRGADRDRLRYFLTRFAQACGDQETDDGCRREEQKSGGECARDSDRVTDDDGGYESGNLSREVDQSRARTHE